MVEIERYLRSEDTALSRAIQKVSPKVGPEYLESQAKRRLDVVVGSSSAFVAVPMIGVLALAKKLEDGDGSFLSQP